MTDAVASLVGASASIAVGVISAFSVPSSPIPDGSVWYRTGKIISRVFTTSLSDQPLPEGSASQATHVIFTGFGTLWKAVIFPGDVLQIDSIGGTKQLEVTKVIADNKFKARIASGDTDLILQPPEEGASYAIIPLGQRTASQATSQVATLLQVIQKRDAEITDWLTGSKDGGPLNNGRYPITGIDGVPKLVPCPEFFISNADSGIDTGYGHKKWNGVKVVKDLYPEKNTITNTWSLEIPLHTSEERVFCVTFPSEVSECRIRVKSLSSLDPVDLHPVYTDPSLFSNLGNVGAELSAKVYFRSWAENGTKLSWPFNYDNYYSGRRDETTILWNLNNVLNFIPNPFSLQANALSYIAVNFACLTSNGFTSSQEYDAIFASIVERV